MVPCKACGTQIVFAQSPKGGMIPLQRVKNIYIVLRANDPMRPDQAKPLPGEELFISHFETCPAASSFSKKKEKP